MERESTLAARVQTWMTTTARTANNAPCGHQTSTYIGAQNAGDHIVRIVTDQGFTKKPAQRGRVASTYASSRKTWDSQTHGVPNASKSNRIVL